MYMTFEETSKLIAEGKALHIAGNENLLKKLPKGKWIGGSTEYFISKDGGKVSNEHFSVTELPYEASIKAYSVAEIENVAVDAYDNGFSIVIIPFDSAIHKDYAQNAAGYKDMFMKKIVGWISGVNLGVAGQTPIAVDGTAAAVYTDKAVVLHLKVPEGKTAEMNIVNIFSQDENTPVITFDKDGFSADKCFVDGKETSLADYVAKNSIDTKMPLVGDYAGNGINVSFKAIDNGVVNFYAPVFQGIQYRMAKGIANYEQEFNSKITEIKATGVAFSCNCILNFLYGELEGKKLDTFVGPITFGEIASQLVNQTLVYVTVK
ncbi:MAG: hypothetical protein LBB36_03405 [Fibromonadaceae bacterium]|jgi:hypothetical protein|nr:hypothetical protein [Fibromonadaceae bacterium]